MSVHYDPLLAKVIVHGSDRGAAIGRMVRALSELVALGVDTTAELLRDVVASPAFAAGDTTTDFLECFAWEPPDVDASSFAAAFVAAGAGPRVVEAPASASEPSPWASLGRWP